jgi:hypothetical protein
MYGPCARGHWTALEAPNCGRDYDFLVAGTRYRVIKEFADNDRDIHAVGEEWVFLGYSYQRHDEGLSLFVSCDGEHEWHIPMHLVPEAEGPIVDYLSECVAPL